MSLDSPMVLPRTDDPDTAGFFRAAREEKVAVCICRACGSLLHLPRSYCHTCGEACPSWVPVRPRGVVESWTKVEQQVHPAFPAPFTLVLVEVAATGARLIGRFHGSADPIIQMSVAATFVQLTPEITIIGWAPASAPIQED